MRYLIKRISNKIYSIIQIGSLRKTYYRSETELQKKFLNFQSDDGSVTLDLGSGPEPRNPFNAQAIYGADIRQNEERNVVYADLSKGKLPFEDNLFDYVTAYDVLEHIERVSSSGECRFPFIALMNEIFRVLKPNGIFFSIQPCYPDKQAFQDPTHVNIMSEDTINLYFCEPAWARIYGYQGSFAMLDEGWLGGKYFAFIRKADLVPELNLNFIQK